MTVALREGQPEEAHQGGTRRRPPDEPAAKWQLAICPASLTSFNYQLCAT